MSIIVQKFGGTSVADVERIQAVAACVLKEVDRGNQVVVVVSAMAGVTNQLISLIDQLIPGAPAGEEYDVVTSTGEQVTAGLLALLLRDKGRPARTWLPWQIPIETDAVHTKAHIVSITCDKMKADLEAGTIAVVPGFQGVSPQQRLTTLGRGGSDTTAVALAHALNAERCDIYTDVDGVFTADPRVVTQAHKLNKVSYEEMFELAFQGAKVLQPKAVELAMRYGVPLKILSSFREGSGTLVSNTDVPMKANSICGIASHREQAKITLLNMPDKPGVAARTFDPMAREHMHVDMIVQNSSEDEQHTHLTFTSALEDVKRVEAMLQARQEDLGFEKMVIDTNIAKVSIVGAGMRSHAGVAQKMFQTLAELDVNIQLISTSEITVSVLIAEEALERVVQRLHTVFNLDEKKNTNGQKVA